MAEISADRLIPTSKKEEEGNLIEISPERLSESRIPSIRKPTPTERIRETYSGIRPTIKTGLEGLGMAGGAALGTPLGLPGQVAGGTLGYAGAKQGINLLDQLMGVAQPQGTKERLSEMGKDVVEGATMELGGRLLPTLPQTIGKGLKKVQEIIPPLRPKAIQTETGKELLKQGTELTGEQIGKNVEIANELQAKIPGLNFTRGQITGDAQALALERALMRSGIKVPRGRFEISGADLNQEQKAFAEKSLQDYYNTQLTAKGKVSDFTDVLTTKKQAMEANVKDAQKKVNLEVLRLGKVADQQQIGKDVLSRLRPAQEMAKKEATELYNKVPNVPVGTETLHKTITNIKSEFDPLVESPKTFPIRVVNGVLQKIEAKKGPVGIREEIPYRQNIDELGKRNWQVGKWTIAEIGTQKLSPENFKYHAEIAKYAQKNIPGLDKEYWVSLGGRGAVASKTGMKSSMFKNDEQAEEYFEIGLFSEPQRQTLKALAEKVGAKRVADAHQAFHEMGHSLGMGDITKESIIDQWSLKETEKFINQYTIEGKEIKDIGFQELRKLRSTVLAERRMARGGANPNPQLDRRLGQIQEAIEETIDTQLKDAKGTAGDLYRQASGKYAEYSKKFKQGTVADVLQKGVRGEETRIALSNVAGNFFTRDGIDDYIRAVGNDKLAVNSMRDYARYDLFNKTFDPYKETISPQKAFSWIQRNGEVLKKLGIKDEFLEIAKKGKGLNISQKELDVFNQSVAAKMLNTEPEEAVKKAFAGSQNYATTANELLAQTKGNKAAQEGLKKAIADHILESSKVTAEGFFTDYKVSVAKLTNQLKKYVPALRTIYKNEPSKLKAIMDVHKGYQINARNVASPIGGGSDTLENFGNFMVGMAGARAGWYYPIVAFKKMLSSYSDGQIRQYLLRASFDPDYAQNLINLAQANMKPQNMQPVIARFDNLMSRFAVLGTKELLEED